MRRSSEDRSALHTHGAACEALGVQTLLKDLGQDMAARVHIDASAAKNIIEREGLVKIRHIDVNVLWVQEQEVRRQLPRCTILGTLNLADLMTKNLARQDINKYSDKLNTMYKVGRAELAPEVHHVRVASEVFATKIAPGGNK